MNLRLIKGSIFHYCSPQNIKWMNDREVTRFLSPRKKTTYLSTFFYFLSHWIRNDKLFAVYLNSKHIGNCGFFAIKNSSAQLRIMIGERDYWGRGIGPEVIRQIVKIAKQTKIQTIWLDVHPDNKRAITLYEKTGFKLQDTVILPGGLKQLRMSKKL